MGHRSSLWIRASWSNQGQDVSTAPFRRPTFTFEHFKHQDFLFGQWIARDFLATSAGNFACANILVIVGLFRRHFSFAFQAHWP